MSRIALVNNTGIYLLRLRRELIARLVELRHEVTSIAPRDTAWSARGSSGISAEWTT